MVVTGQDAVNASLVESLGGVPAPEPSLSGVGRHDNHELLTLPSQLLKSPSCSSLFKKERARAPRV